MAEEGSKDIEMKDAPSEPAVSKLETRRPNTAVEGFAKHSEKEKIIDTFRRTVWPLLIDAGWTKEDTDEGETLFIPKGVSIETGEAGKDYYYRIKDVIDRLNLRATDEESSIADSYRREMSRPVSKPLVPSPPRRRRGLPIARNTSPEKSPKIDLSWKDGGHSYPKRCSNVGKNYQVSNIPKAGTFKTDQSLAYCDKIWDPALAKEHNFDLEAKDNVLNDVPSNLKETAHFLLMEKKFNVEAFKEAIKSVKPTDGSDWSKEQQEAFTLEIFRARKDMNAVATKMKIPMKTCLAYYLGRFKASDDYRLLKTVCCEERLEKLEELQHGFDACCICGDGGNLLICDGCEKEYHPSCTKPRLARVPDGDWECDECVATKFLAVQEYLLQRTNIFVRQLTRKRDLDELNGDNGEKAVETNSIKEAKLDSNKVGLRLAEGVLEAVRKFAKAGSEALSIPADGSKPVGAATTASDPNNTKEPPGASKAIKEPSKPRETVTASEVPKSEAPEQIESANVVVEPVKDSETNAASNEPGASQEATLPAKETSSDAPPPAKEPAIPSKAPSVIKELPKTPEDQPAADTSVTTPNAMEVEELPKANEMDCS